LKRFLAALSSALLVVVLSAPSAHADDNPLPLDQRLVYKSSIWDPARSGAWDGKTWLYGATFQGGQNPGSPAPFIEDRDNQRFCDSWEDNCDTGKSMFVRGYPKLCDGSEQVSACIRSLELRVDGGEWIAAEPNGNWDSSSNQRSLDWFADHLTRNPQLGEVLDVSTTQGWSERPEWSAPASGRGPLLFRSGIKHAGGTGDYLLDVQYLLDVSAANKTTVYNEFDIGLYPVLIEEFAPSHNGVELISRYPNGEVGHGGTGPWFRNADFRTNGLVAYSARFPAKTEVRLVMNVPKALGGWFHSRLSGPELSLETSTPTMNTLVVTGSPAEIPITNIFLDGLDPKNKEIVEKYNSAYWLAEHRRKLAAGESAGISGSMWGPNSGLFFFKDWYPYLDERAKGSAQAWLVSRMPVGRLGENRCLNDTSKIQGLINTNAMVYQSSIPAYRDGFLNYEVAGVHRANDGSLNIGEYTLQIRSETARCIYGFGSAPVSATVQVVSDEGKEVVATTQVAERDGWLKLTAAGFTFSEKNIRVKITQPAPVTQIPVAGKPVSATKPPASFLTSRVGTKLTNTQKAQIKKFAVSSGKKTFMCSANYRAAKDKVTALRRAELICAEAKRAVPGGKTIIRALVTKNSAQDGTVLINPR
jgi:hypothetical protein